MSREIADIVNEARDLLAKRHFIPKMSFNRALLELLVIGFTCLKSSSDVISAVKSDGISAVKSDVTGAPFVRSMLVSTTTTDKQTQTTALRNTVPPDVDKMCQQFPNPELVRRALDKYRTIGTLTKTNCIGLLEGWSKYDQDVLAETLTAFVDVDGTIEHPKAYINGIYRNKLATKNEARQIQTIQDTEEEGLSEKGRERLRMLKAKRLMWSDAMQAFYPVDRYGKADHTAKCLDKLDIPMDLIKKYR